MYLLHKGCIGKPRGKVAEENPSAWYVLLHVGNKLEVVYKLSPACQKSLMPDYKRIMTALCKGTPPAALVWSRHIQHTCC